MTTISLCVVTQGKSPNLPDCIRSAADFVDEIIVLDTGMLNGSGEWAVNNGAVVVPYQWAGNIADARTAAAREAKGDWVLMMDCNEVLTEGAGAIIRAAIEAGGMDCGFLPLVNVSHSDQGLTAKPQGDAEIARMPRLLRRTADLRWDSGPKESVNTWIAMRARRVRVIDTPIVREVEAAVNESESASQAVSALAEGPPQVNPPASNAPNDDSPQQEFFVAPGQESRSSNSEEAPSSDPVAAHLAEAWHGYHNDNLDQARESAEAAWSLLTAEHPEVIQVMTLRAHIQILDANPKAALGTIAKVLEWGFHHPNIDMLQGVVAETTGMTSLEYGHQQACLERAEAAFMACTAHDGEISARDSLPGVTTWAANTRLGAVRLGRGDVDGAQLAFEAALAADPEHAEATLGVLECWLEQGEAERILEPLMFYMEANIADAWMLAASACEEIGRVEDALLFVGKAYELQQDGLQASLHRNLRMLELLAMASLYTGRPLAGPGPWGAVGAIISRQPLPGIAKPAPVDGPKVVRLVSHCVAAGWSDMIEALLEPRAEQVAPGISDVVRGALKALGAESMEAEIEAPVFIGGTWDSGVQSLQGALDTHTALEAGEESKLIPILCSLRNEWMSTMTEDLEAAGIGEQQMDDAVRGFVRGLLSFDPSKETPRRVETTPHTLLHIETMARIYPQARFIHVVRDGHEVVSSLLERDWIDPATGEKVWCCQDAKAASEYWVHVVDAIRAQGERIPDRYLEIQYEDLIAHPEVVMRHVLAFLGERWEPAVVDAVEPVPSPKGQHHQEVEQAFAMHQPDAFTQGDDNAAFTK